MGQAAGQAARGADLHEPRRQLLICAASDGTQHADAKLATVGPSAIHYRVVAEAARLVLEHVQPDDTGPLVPGSEYTYQAYPSSRSIVSIHFELSACLTSESGSAAASLRPLIVLTALCCSDAASHASKTLWSDSQQTGGDWLAQREHGSRRLGLTQPSGSPRRMHALHTPSCCRRSVGGVRCEGAR